MAIRNERDLKPLPYSTLQTFQTAKTLELQIVPFCFLLRVMCCLLILYIFKYKINENICIILTKILANTKYMIIFVFR